MAFCLCRCLADSSQQQQRAALERRVQARAEEIRLSVAEEELIQELPSALRRRGSRWRWAKSLLVASAAEEEAEEDPPDRLAPLVQQSLGSQHDADDLPSPPRYRGLGSSWLPPPPPSARLRVTRIVSDDVKEAVNTVLMPFLAQKNVDLQKARKRLRANEISVSECREQTRNAAREFDLRYAATIRAAKEHASETGEVPLRKLVSSDDSWTKVETYAKATNVSLANFTPRALRTAATRSKSDEELLGDRPRPTSPES